MSYKKRIDFFSSCVQNSAVKTVLFLGCGSGIEALCFHNVHPDAFVVGADVSREMLDAKVAKNVHLIICDGVHLPFKNETFTWEYCSHVLEHVPNLLRTVFAEEMKRTTEKGVFIACPNAQRVISYFYSADKVSLSDMVMWNINDWLGRIQGVFHSYRKYHRGFTEYELKMLLMKSFRKVHCLTVEYDVYMAKGTKYSPFTKILSWTGLLKMLGSSHTFLCSN